MEKKRFTTYTTLKREFTSTDGKIQVRPYVIIEGNLTRDIELKAGKSAYYVFTSIGTNVSAEEVHARATGDYKKDGTYNQQGFVNLKFFGKTAERLAKVGSKGLRLVVWGDIEEESYKDAQKNDKKSVTITVENFIPIFKGAKVETEDSTLNQPDTNQPSANEEFFEPSDDYDDEEIPF